MKKTIIAVVLALCVAPVFGQEVYGSITTEERPTQKVTQPTVLLGDVCIGMNAASVEVIYTDAEGNVTKTEKFFITDGVAETNEDDYLTGDGSGSTPRGLVTAIAQSGAAGKNQFNQVIAAWLMSRVEQ